MKTATEMSASVPIQRLRIMAADLATVMDEGAGVDASGNVVEASTFIDTLLGRVRRAIEITEAWLENPIAIEGVEQTKVDALIDSMRAAYTEAGYDPRFETVTVGYERTLVVYSGKAA